MAKKKARSFDQYSREEKDLCWSLATSDGAVSFNETAMQVWFLDKAYSLTKNQFAVLKILWATHLPSEDGLPESAFRGERSDDSITGFKNSVGYDSLPSSGRVRNSFRRSPLWGFLIIRTKERRLKLNLPRRGREGEEITPPPDIDALMNRRATKAQPFSRKTRKKRVFSSR